MRLSRRLSLQPAVIHEAAEAASDAAADADAEPDEEAAVVCLPSTITKVEPLNCRAIWVNEKLILIVILWIIFKGRQLFFKTFF